MTLEEELHGLMPDFIDYEIRDFPKGHEAHGRDDVDGVQLVVVNKGEDYYVDVVSSAEASTHEIVRVIVPQMVQTAIDNNVDDLELA